MTLTAFPPFTSGTSALLGGSVWQVACLRTGVTAIGDSVGDSESNSIVFWPDFLYVLSS